MPPSPIRTIRSPMDSEELGWDDPIDMSDPDRYELEVEIGALRVLASGDDPDWVAEQFDEAWVRAFDEVGEMADAIRAVRGYE